MSRTKDFSEYLKTVLLLKQILQRMELRLLSYAILYEEALRIAAEAESEEISFEEFRARILKLDDRLRETKYVSDLEFDYGELLLLL